MIIKQPQHELHYDIAVREISIDRNMRITQDLLLDSYKITILSNKPEVQFKLKIIVIIVHIIYFVPHISKFCNTHHNALPVLLFTLLLSPSKCIVI